MLTRSSAQVTFQTILTKLRLGCRFWLDHFYRDCTALITQTFLLCKWVLSKCHMTPPHCSFSSYILLVLIFSWFLQCCCSVSFCCKLVWLNFTGASGSGTAFRELLKLLSKKSVTDWANKTGAIGFLPILNTEAWWVNAEISPYSQTTAALIHETSTAAQLKDLIYCLLQRECSQCRGTGYSSHAMF